MMKYIVKQKIKAFGLEKGDIFEEINGRFIRTYRSGDTIEVPEYILRDHPDWFEKVVIHFKKRKRLEKLNIEETSLVPYAGLVVLSNKINELIESTNELLEESDLRCLATLKNNN